MDTEYVGNVEASGDDHSVEPGESRRPSRALLDVCLLRTTTRNLIFGALKVPAEERIKAVDPGDAKFGSEDIVRKKQGRGRGRSSTGRGRGSKANDQVLPQASPLTSPPSNGQPENALQKESRPKEVHGKVNN
ncbi:60S ribosomal protein L5-2-like isoform X2 [Papaver somniferum]|uniref:60S ribosomal protein L5-2-like isoform X2 n=1 Tax=Papaver somniferum TaxID=3469 RepID=UPI000E6FD83A|nr:60S ribosomal protein L5-2-like isoform X2 [Papaver somniferum]